MAEGRRNTRLPSGYAEDFVNAVEEDLQCSACHLPLKEPVLTRCGHRFCKECLEEHFKRSVLTWEIFTPVEDIRLNCDFSLRAGYYVRDLWARFQKQHIKIDAGTRTRVHTNTEKNKEQ